MSQFGYPERITKANLVRYPEKYKKQIDADLSFCIILLLSCYLLLLLLLFSGLVARSGTVEIKYS